MAGGVVAGDDDQDRLRQESRVRRFLATLLLLALMQGCASVPSKAPSKALTEAEVLAIARKAVAANDTGLERARFDRPEFDPKQNWWTVLVRRLPAETAGDKVEKIETTGGGHQIVVIDVNGKVIEYIRGR